MTIEAVFDKEEIGFDESLQVDITDSSDPNALSLLSSVTLDDLSIVIASFVAHKLRANNYRAMLYGWQIGGPFTSRSLDILIASPDGILEVSPTLKVNATNNAFIPIMQWFKDLILNDPILSEIGEEVRFLRPMHQYRSESPTFFVYPASVEYQSLMGTLEMRMLLTIRVELLSDMTNMDETVESIPHHIFVSRFVELVRQSPSLSESLKIISATPRTANIPWNSFLYQSMEASWVDVSIQMIVQSE